MEKAGRGIGLGRNIRIPVLEKLSLKCLLDIKWCWIADGYMSLEFRDKVWAENTNLEVLSKDGRFKARGWISTSKCGSIDRKVGTRLIIGSLVNYLKV